MRVEPDLKLIWQKQTDNTSCSIAFASILVNDAEKNHSIGELERKAVVWGLDKFRFCLYGKVVYL